MKNIMFVVFAVSMVFASCSNPSDSAMYYPTVVVPSGTPTQTEETTPNQNENGEENNNQSGSQNGNENEENSATLVSNECDMGGDFNLEDWVGKIYVDNKLPQSTNYSNKYKKINWDSDAFETNSNHKVHLYITKNENKLIVEKNEAYSGNNSWFEIKSVVRTNDNRIDVTLKLAN